MGILSLDTFEEATQDARPFEGLDDRGKMMFHSILVMCSADRVHEIECPLHSEFLIMIVTSYSNFAVLLRNLPRIIHLRRVPPAKALCLKIVNLSRKVT